MKGEKNITAALRAEILLQVLPYIKKHSGSIIVVKYGGNAMIDEALQDQVMEDLSLLNAIGVKIVLVHGGGPEITEMLSNLGKKSAFIDGLRVSDKDSMDIISMVLCGKVNKRLVSLLRQKSAKTVGLSGLDGSLLEADFLDKKYGYVGRVVSVNPLIIEDLLSKGYIPVISSIAYNDKGEIFNVNADTAASAISAALKADRLIMMSDVAGILRNKDDENSLIKEIDIQTAKKLKSEGIINSGMIPKVECCINAIENGVKKVVIMSGTIPHSILTELLTDEGAGTLITR